MKLVVKTCSAIVCLEGATNCSNAAFPSPHALVPLNLESNVQYSVTGLTLKFPIAIAQLPTSCILAPSPWYPVPESSVVCTAVLSKALL